jgi:hypothetical protein
MIVAQKFRTKNQKRRRAEAEKIEMSAARRCLQGMSPLFES